MTRNEINGIVIARLEVSPFLSGAKVKVSTTDGKVTLEGTVLDAKQKEEAKKIALSTEGVTEVMDKLEIVAPEVHNLMSVQAASEYNLRLIPNVKAALLKDPSLDVTGISLLGTKGREGIFILSGKVKSEEDKTLAERLVDGVNGVKYAINELEIGEPECCGNIAESFEVKSNPTSRQSLMEKHAVSSRNLVLIGKIKNAMMRHPFLDTTDIRVSLAEGTSVGIYKLEGTVPDAKHVEAAKLAANSVSGVEYIDNRLELR